MTTPMPKRSTEADPPTVDYSKLTQFINNPGSELERTRYGSLYIDNLELLKKNMDVFRATVVRNHFGRYVSGDYDCLKYIHDLMKNKLEIQLALYDDGENKDRSYIDMNYFEKCDLIIPYSYILWNPKLNEKPLVCQGFHMEFDNPLLIQNCKALSLEMIKRTKEIIVKLWEKYKDCNDLEKTIIISNYIQNLVQFIEPNNISEGPKGIYITDSKGIEISFEVHSPETVLLHHYGVCEGIANATTILSNNPLMNLNVRTVRSNGHVWNQILMNGQYYYLDNTWNITRNPNQYTESLKASSFCDDYLLFGSKKSQIIGHHDPFSVIQPLAEEDYPIEEIKHAVRTLSLNTSFDNYQPPIFESRIKK